MLTMAFTSPVATSITIATPTLPFTFGSFSSSIKALSDKSCIPTSMVVMMSAPSIGGVSVIFKNLFRTLRRWMIPSVPRKIESYDNSRPQRAVSFAPNMSPTVRCAKEPNGRLRALNSSQWKPLLNLDRCKIGKVWISLNVL